MAKLQFWAVGLVVFLAVGCGVTPGETITGGSGGTGGDGGTGGGTSCPGDPAEGPVFPECGVWVSTLGNDGGEGTQSARVATLAHAIGLAAKGTGDPVFYRRNSSTGAPACQPW